MPRDMDHSHHHGHCEGLGPSHHDAASSGHHHHRLRAIAPTGDKRLIALFREGTTKVLDIADLIERRPHLLALSKDQVARSAHVAEGGLGVHWDDDLSLPSDVFWDEGMEVDTPFDGLLAIAEATDIWNVSRSTISQDIAKGTIQEGLDAVNFGKQWVLTRNAMLRVYGPPKKE